MFIFYPPFPLPSSAVITLSNISQTDKRREDKTTSNYLHKYVARATRSSSISYFSREKQLKKHHLKTAKLLRLRLLYWLHVIVLLTPHLLFHFTQTDLILIYALFVKWKYLHVAAENEWCIAKTDSVCCMQWMQWKIYICNNECKLEYLYACKYYLFLYIFYLYLY